MQVLQGTNKGIPKGEPITEIKFEYETGRTIQLWINDTLTYLTIDEALDLKDELQDALEGVIT